MSQDLLQQIDDLVASKTFGLDALDGIKAIKDKLKQTLDEIDYSKKQSSRDAERINSLEDLNRTQAQRIDFLNKKVADGEETLEKAKIALYEADKEKAVAAAYKDALYTVFKPSAVREEIQRSVAVPLAGNPGGAGYSPSAGWVGQGNETQVTVRSDE